LKNTFLIIGAGGAGISLTSMVSKHLHSDLFPEIKTAFIDTTDREFNMLKWVRPTDFHKVTSSKLNDSMDGSGGEQSTNIEEIKESLKDIVDGFNLPKYNGNIFVSVISSASGGTGSVINIFLSEYLHRLGIPTIHFLVADSKDEKQLNNSLTTIKAFENKAKKVLKAPVSVFILSNRDPVKNSSVKKAVDNSIIVQHADLSLLFGGSVTGFDNKDNHNFLRLHEYKGIEIIPGLYKVSTLRDIAGSKSIKSIRIIESKKDESDELILPFSVKQSKTGYISGDNVEKAKKLYKHDTNNNFPIFICSEYSGNSVIVKQLNDIKEAFKNNSNSVDIDTDYNIDDDSVDLFD
jgi:hypothetical protein